MKYRLSVFIIAIVFCTNGFAQTGMSTHNARTISCNKQYYIPTLYQSVQDDERLDNCAENFQPVYGIWLTFTIFRSGELSFDLIPDMETHDLDFVLIQQKSGDVVRCNAAGPSISEQIWCAGMTGMRGTGSISSLGPGCPPTDSYVSSLPVKKGDRYLLYVNNFNGPDGFTISFKESLLEIPVLLGEPVSVTPQEDGGMLVEMSQELLEYEPYWEFRQGQPQRANGPGPHLIKTIPGSQFGWRMELIRDDGCICELEDDLSEFSISENALRFWPNPSREHVYIDLRDLPILTDGTRRTIQLMDHQGKILQELLVSFEVEVFRIETVPPGIHILRVMPDEKYGLMVKM